MVKSVQGPEPTSEIWKIQLSVDTVSRRIGDIHSDIKTNVKDKIMSEFSLKIDEATAVTSHVQFLVNILFNDEDLIAKNFLFLQMIARTSHR